MEVADIRSVGQVSLEVSFTKEALEWLETRGEGDVVIDLTYKKGRCTSAFCRTVPSIGVYIGRKDGRYTFEPLISGQGKTVHVAKPIIEAAEKRDFQVVIGRKPLRGLRLRGIDPYELGL
ncbi:MAG: hypothetical protein ACE5HJ_07735 [Thermoplasmata archaeon]